MTDADDLTDSDEEILDELQEGARTKGALVDATGLHRNTVGHRLDILEPSGIVEVVHDSTALYELVDDPREEGEPLYTAGSDEPITHTGPNVDVQAIKDERDELQRDLEDCRAQLEQADNSSAEVPIGDCLASVSAALTALSGQSPDVEMARSELERVQEVLEEHD